MRVYAVMARWTDCPHVEPEATEGILMEVFANEQDAKKYKGIADIEGEHGEYVIIPRELRTAWRG